MRSLYSAFLPLLLISTSHLASADCNNGDRQRCDGPDYGECVYRSTLACPGDCSRLWCSPNPDCNIAAQQFCGFSCCSFTDREGCEKCEESSGLDGMCDNIKCYKKPTLPMAPHRPPK